jgi:hypothetical protein
MEAEEARRRAEGELVLAKAELERCGAGRRLRLGKGIYRVNRQSSRSQQAHQAKKTSISLRFVRTRKCSSLIPYSPPVSSPRGKLEKCFCSCDVTQCPSLMGPSSLVVVLLCPDPGAGSVWTA